MPQIEQWMRGAAELIISQQPQDGYKFDDIGLVANYISEKAHAPVLSEARFKGKESAQ